MTYSDIIVTREKIKGYIGKTPLCMGWRHKYIGRLLKIVPFSAATAFVNRMFPVPQAARKKQKKINYFSPFFANIVSRMYPNYSCTHNKKEVAYYTDNLTLFYSHYATCAGTFFPFER